MGKRLAQIVGGPRDGETVEVVGTRLYMPVPVEVSLTPGQLLPLPEIFPKEAFDLFKDKEGKLYYVRRNT